MSNPYEGNPYPENSGQSEGGNQYGGSQYGQNPYDQNPSGQPSYGQNPYGNNSYGQTPFGQTPFGQNPYGQNPYGQSPYGGYGTMAQPHPQGTTVLVLGILSVVVCFVCGIVAAVIGTHALREIDANPSAYSNRQNVTIGRILGFVGIGVQGLTIIGYIIVFAVGIGSSQY